MQIKGFKLANIGRFEQVDIPLAPLDDNGGNVTVFVGNNGAGKTSLLKSLVISLSWFVARIRSESGQGLPIPQLTILNGAQSAQIDIAVNDTKQTYEWTLSKARTGYINLHKSNLVGASLLAKHYRQQLATSETASFPLIAYYSVERFVEDIPLKAKRKHSFSQLDGYEQTLTQGVDFKRFFEWFRLREDAENESGISPAIIEQLQAETEVDPSVLRKLKALDASSKDDQLNAVRNAISQFMPEFDNLRVVRHPELHMSVDKKGEALNVHQLSQGEKSLLALVGDIARRLAMMNPGLDNPLAGDGIVLIDEVDMHLHPGLQRALTRQLVSTFPNCQFVLTTHSPLVISDSENVLTYVIDEDGVQAQPVLFGQDANTVLMEVMDTDARNAEVNRQINDLLDAIHDARLTEAKTMLAKLESPLPANNMELIKARFLLKKQVLRHEKS